MSSNMIKQLIPDSAGQLSDEDLLALYAYPAIRPWTRFNFIASLDGSAAFNGVSAPLGNDGDRRLFGLIRRLCDVILVGAGTVRAEGYAGPLVNEDDSRWRSSNGLSPHPALAVISGSLDLDPDAELFSKAPLRPIVITASSADPERRQALSEVADVVVLGDRTVDPAACAAWLAEQGLGRVLCEGGPGIFGAFIADDSVDELCLSLSPLLTGGHGPPIAAGPESSAIRRLTLASLLQSDSALYGRWVRNPPGQAS